MHTTQHPEKMNEGEKNLAEFMTRLDDLIKFAATHRFKGATQAFRQLRRVKNLAVFK